MRHEGNGQPTVYKVILSAKHRAMISESYDRHVLQGKREFFLTVLRQLYDRLRREPMVFGEPLFRLQAPELLVRQGAIAPLVVIYGVHEEQSAVIVREVNLLS
jgi:hypothetical protein